MKLRGLIMVTALAGTMSACTDENSVANQDTELTGERFFDAAATKIMLGAEDLDRKVANCIVTAITADGKIGLGELNQSTLDEQGIPTSGVLRDAYRAAQRTCN